MASQAYPGRLNVFQQAMLQWNDMHPYHAVHVMRLSGVPDPERTRQIIANRLRLHGLSGLSLDRRAGRFRFDAEPAALETRVVTVRDDPVRSLSAEIELQLNRRFEISGRFTPFRFFLLPEEESFLLGATYFHPIADAESVARLMRELAVDSLTSRPANTAPLLDRYPPRHDRLFVSLPNIALRKLLLLPSEIRTMRHSYRAPLRDAEDLSNRFCSGVISRRTLERVLETVRVWGITLHDLLLAVLMKALTPLAPERLQEERRRNISLGSIVNVRRDHHIDGESTFGLFLGSFVVSHPAPDGIHLRDLALDLRRQTRRIKSRKGYLATPLELSIARRVIALYSTARQRKFYHKHHPLWGGITNMNMNAFWPTPSTVCPQDYFRAVSTGPVTPLVLSASTFRDQMNIGLTYRPAMFTPADIEGVRAEIIRQLDELEAGE